jgi:hypothetical protein
MDDELDQRLSTAASDVARVAHLTTAERIRARGDRRRVGVIAASAAGLLAVAGVGVGVVAAGAGDGEVADRGLGPQISDRLRMPHEGEPGWTRNDDADIRAAFDGCAPTDPTLAGRTDARTISGPGQPSEGTHSPATVTEQLFLYQDETTAQSVIAALKRGVTACGWIDHVMSTELNGKMVNSPYPNLDIEKVSGFQIGNAVFVVYSRLGGPGVPSTAVNEVRLEVVHDPEPDRWLMAAELCRVMEICQYDAQGRISPPPGRGDAESPTPAATGK